MKSLISLIPLLFVVLIANAQRIEVTKGPVVDPRLLRSEMDVPRFKFVTFKPVRYSTSLFFNTQARKTYSGFGFSGGSFAFAVLDDYVKYGGVKKLSSEVISGKVGLHAFVTIGNKMYVFYTQEYTDRDEFSMYVNEVSPDMVLLGSPIIIQHYKNLKQYGTVMSLAVSKNKKNLLITRIFDGKLKEKQKLSCKVISDSFSEVWTREFELESTDKELSLKSVDVDNSGNFYLLVEYSAKREVRPVLYSYFWQSKSMKSFDPGLMAGENFGTSLELLNGERPFVVGLNQQDKKVSYFISKVNTQAETLERLGASPMPDDFYKASQFRVFSTKDWRVTQIVSLSNDNIVASIEARMVELRNGVPVAHYTYNTFLVSFAASGQPKWSHTVQKKQSTMAEMAGHILVPAKNNVLIIYNDHPDNLLKKPDDKRVEGFIGLKKAVVTVQEIDENGKVSKYAFTKDRELENYALNLNSTTMIEGDYYYAPAIFLKSRLSIESRNVTFRIR